MNPQKSGDLNDSSLRIAEQKFRDACNKIISKQIGGKPSKKNLFVSDQLQKIHLRPSMIDRACLKTAMVSSTPNPNSVTRYRPFTPDSSRSVSPIDENGVLPNPPQGKVDVTCLQFSAGRENSVITVSSTDGTSGKEVDKVKQGRTSQRNCDTSMTANALKDKSLPEIVEADQIIEKSKNSIRNGQSTSDIKKLARKPFSRRPTRRETQTQTGVSLNRNVASENVLSDYSSDDSAIQKMDDTFFKNVLKKTEANKKNKKKSLSMDSGVPWRPPSGFGERIKVTPNSVFARSDSTDDESCDETFLPKLPKPKKVFTNKKKLLGKENTTLKKNLNVKNVVQDVSVQVALKPLSECFNEVISVNGFDSVNPLDSVGTSAKRGKESRGNNKNNIEGKQQSSKQSKSSLWNEGSKQIYSDLVSDSHMNGSKFKLGKKHFLFHDESEEVSSEEDVAIKTRQNTHDNVKSRNEMLNQNGRIQKNISGAVKGKTKGKMNTPQEIEDIELDTNLPNDRSEKLSSNVEDVRKMKSQISNLKGGDDSIQASGDVVKQPTKSVSPKRKSKKGISKTAKDNLEETTILDEHGIGRINKKQDVKETVGSRKTKASLNEVQCTEKTRTQKLDSVKKRSKATTGRTQNGIEDEITPPEELSRIIDQTLNCEPSVLREMRHPNSWVQTVEDVVFKRAKAENSKKKTKNGGSQTKQDNLEGTTILEEQGIGPTKKVRDTDNRKTKDIPKEERSNKKSIIQEPRSTPKRKKQDSTCGVLEDVPLEAIKNYEDSFSNINENRTRDSAVSVGPMKRRQQHHDDLIQTFDDVSSNKSLSPKRKRNHKKNKVEEDHVEEDTIIDRTVQYSLRNRKTETDESKMRKTIQNMIREFGESGSQKSKSTQKKKGTESTRKHDRTHDNLEDVVDDVAQNCIDSDYNSVESRVQHSQVSVREVSPAKRRSQDDGDHPVRTSDDDVSKRPKKSVISKSGDSKTKTKEGSYQQKQKKAPAEKKQKKPNESFGKQTSITDEVKPNETCEGLRRSTRVRRQAPIRSVGVFFVNSRRTYNQINGSTCRDSSFRKNKSTNRRTVANSKVNSKSSGRVISTSADISAVQNVEPFEEETYNTTPILEEEEEVRPPKKSVLTGRVSKKRTKKPNKEVRESLKKILDETEDLDNFLNICHVGKVEMLRWAFKNSEFKEISGLDGVSMSVREGFPIGRIKIQPGKRKPKQVSNNFQLGFYITEGEAQVRVQDKSGVFKKDDMFVVPAGCEYYIKNLNKEELMLSFTRFPRKE